MNTYEKIELALAKNAYKKGAYKGDAPADPDRRARNHIRLTKRGLAMQVIMHRTDILTAHKDGSITIDLGGWSDSSTTREAINDALGTYCTTRPFLRVLTHNVFSMSQLCVTSGSKAYRYYDGITFDAEGRLVTDPIRFDAMRMDTEASKEFMDDIKTSGFKDMFPVLYATATPTTAYDGRRAHALRARLGHDYHANEWPEIVAAAKYETRWTWDSATQSRGSRYVEKGDAKSCWEALMARAKSDLTRPIKSTTTELIIGVKPTFSPASE